MKDETDRDKDIQGLLRSLPIKPPPPELRDRVLESAKAAREAAAWTTPLLRAALAGTAALLAIIIVIGGLVDRSQSAQLLALSDGRPTAQAAGEQVWALESEELRDLLGQDELSRQRWLSAFQQAGKQVSLRKDVFDLEKEVFDGQVISENPN